MAILVSSRGKAAARGCCIDTLVIVPGYQAKTCIGDLGGLRAAFTWYAPGYDLQGQVRRAVMVALSKLTNQKATSLAFLFGDVVDVVVEVVDVVVEVVVDAVVVVVEVEAEVVVVVVMVAGLVAAAVGGGV